jgi:hypothetical protein
MPCPTNSDAVFNKFNPNTSVHVKCSLKIEITTITTITTITSHRMKLRSRRLAIFHAVTVLLLKTSGI